MRRSLTAALLFALAAGPLASAAPVKHQVDASHTSVVFSVGHMGFSFTYGMFKQAYGEVALDPASPVGGRFSLGVKVASISTGNEKRDQHLLAADFFDAERYPEITFDGVVQGVEKDDKGRDVYQVKGRLALHGVEQKVTLPIRLLHAGADRAGKQRVGFHADLVVKRSEYGMTNSVGPISDNVGVTFSFEAAAP